MGGHEQGRQGRPEYRCRLVAKETKKGKPEDLFAATPPLEAKKVLLSLLASLPGSCLDFADVVKAYFRAKARRRAHVDMPKEDHQDGMVGGSRRRCAGRDTPN